MYTEHVICKPFAKLHFLEISIEPDGNETMRSKQKCLSAWVDTRSGIRGEEQVKETLEVSRSAGTRIASMPLLSFIAHNPSNTSSHTHTNTHRSHVDMTGKGCKCVFVCKKCDPMAPTDCSHPPALRVSHNDDTTAPSVGCQRRQQPTAAAVIGPFEVKRCYPVSSHSSPSDELE